MSEIERAVRAYEDAAGLLENPYWLAVIRNSTPEEAQARIVKAVRRLGDSRRDPDGYGHPERPLVAYTGPCEITPAVQAMVGGVG
jgi:hypothetical protein